MFSHIYAVTLFMNEEQKRSGVPEGGMPQRKRDRNCIDCC